MKKYVQHLQTSFDHKDDFQVLKRKDLNYGWLTASLDTHITLCDKFNYRPETDAFLPILGAKKQKIVKNTIFVGVIMGCGIFSSLKPYKSFLCAISAENTF